MSPLAALLRRRIAQDGPISVADYMATALGHPEFGYYRTGEPFGSEGDFVTAPEVSQMFGELIGLWCGVVWESMGRPDPILVIELGPGRGTLMDDALRASVRAMPGFGDAVRLHLVETSPRLKKMQQRTLRHAHPGISVQWNDALDTVPEGPSLIVANEFFDALPVHQYVRDGAQWHERRIGLGGDGFEFVLEPVAPPSLPPALAAAPPNTIVEVCPQGMAVAHALGHRVCRSGGAALIVDYGHPASAPGDTLQSVRRHRFHDVLDRPGEADLTAHVDFEQLVMATAAAGARSFGPVPQALFLNRLGIAERAEALLRQATPEQGKAVTAAFQRLVHPDQMGLLFLVLAVTHPDLPPPPAFDAPSG